jgi:Glycosyl transferase family 2
LPVGRPTDGRATRSVMPAPVLAEAMVERDPLPVSVVIPVYDRAEMLKRALASVWMQTPRAPAEVIVVDDGSRDDTSLVARELGARVIRHPENRGLSAARNTGLEEASYPWIALLDSDDEWLPHHLDHVWGLRDGHVLVAGSSLNCGDDPGRDRFRGPVATTPVVLREGHQLIFPGNPVPVSASLFRRDLALKLGGFRPYRGVVEDFDMWLRMLEHGTAICSPTVSIIYHVHDAQMSLRDARTMQLAHIDASDAHLRRTGGSRRSIRRWEGVAAWDNLRRAVESGQLRGGIQSGLHIATSPQRIAGVLRIWAWRFLVRQRSAELRGAGIGTQERRRPMDHETRAVGARKFHTDRRVDRTK